MILTGNDVRRLLSVIRARATRARAALGRIVVKTNIKRPSASTLRGIEAELSETARHAKAIAQVLDKAERG